VRLARLLFDLMPDEPECAGLLALALATEARRDTRFDDAGDLVLLADQDRSRWHVDDIELAKRLLIEASRRGRPGPYQLQAMIACLHGSAASAEVTDWQQIANLYRVLEDLNPSAVVRVNRAVAVAEAHGPDVALSLLEDVDLAVVGEWHLYWSTLGELLRREGRLDEARAAFDSALACNPNDTDRRFLERRRAELA
jgi:RNA polymerase sigma-70 factor (ECF subfamily)